MKQNPRSNLDSLAKRWFAIIKKYEIIHKWELVDALGISLDQYYRSTSYMRHRFSSVIDYDGQTWRYAKMKTEVTK